MKIEKLKKRTSKQNFKSEANKIIKKENVKKQV